MEGGVMAMDLICRTLNIFNFDFREKSWKFLLFARSIPTYSTHWVQPQLQSTLVDAEM